MSMSETYRRSAWAGLAEIDSGIQSTKIIITVAVRILIVFIVVKYTALGHEMSRDLNRPCGTVNVSCFIDKGV